MNNIGNILYKNSRPITEVRNKYEWISYKYGLYNYRVISSGELLVKLKDINIPLYIKDFILDNKEVLLMCNFIGDKVQGIVFRGIEEKAFINYNLGRGTFYGLGDLDKDFKYGDLIVLVESAVDRDLCANTITKNCLSLLTSSITRAQATVLSNLTNKVLLLLDNDKAGNEGTTSTKKKLNTLGVSTKIITKSNRIKDLGDIAELLMNNKVKEANNIIDMYKTQILINGGKIL